MDPSDETYARLLKIRTGMRHFERWSEQQAKAAGLTTAHHQLLLAIRGHDDPRGPTVGEIADYLLLRHHSVVGLIDRAESLGLICRARCDDDRRVVRLSLSREGAGRLEALSMLHLEELKRLGAHFSEVSVGLMSEQRHHGLVK
ncbi:MAG TPA: MarR family transcriptional regulator [Acidimicrobiales bacterium]